MVIVGAEIPPVPEGRPPSVHEPIEYQRHDLHHFEGKFQNLSLLIGVPRHDRLCFCLLPIHGLSFKARRLKL